MEIKIFISTNSYFSIHCEESTYQINNIEFYKDNIVQDLEDSAEELKKRCQLDKNAFTLILKNSEYFFGTCDENNNWTIHTNSQIKHIPMKSTHEIAHPLIEDNNLNAKIDKLFKALGGKHDLTILPNQSKTSENRAGIWVRKIAAKITGKEMDDPLLEGGEEEQKIHHRRRCNCALV